MNLKFSRPDGTPIQDWRQWSPPKAAKRWRAGRSAIELARAWFTAPAPRIPPEFESLLDSSVRLRGLTDLVGTPELETQLPEAGEGRNHDLVLEGQTENGKVLIAVEAKADEKFGQRLGKYWLQKKEERDVAGGKPSRDPERIEALLTQFAGPKAHPWDQPWATLRYQLLTAAMGTLLEAEKRGAVLAVMVIHEFRTSETDPERLARNSEDLEAFLTALGVTAPGEFAGGKLYGPWVSPGISVPLLVGKAVFDWGTA